MAVEVKFNTTTLSKAIELVQLYIEDQLSNGRTEISPIPYLAGGPGIGKSAMLASMVSHLRAKDGKPFAFKSDHPALRPLEMFSGIPEIVRNDQGELVTKWTKPEIVDLPEAKPGENYLVWLWDDFHLVDPSQAKFGFEIFTYRKIHNYQIPENTVMILAGNHSTKAGARNTLSPIINRLGIYKVTNPVEDWADLYLSKVPLEERITIVEVDPENVVEPHPSVVSFLLKNQEFANEEEDSKEPFGSFRSWTFAGRILTRYFDKIAPHKNSREQLNDIRLIIQAHATPKAAAEFENYYRIYQKFDPVVVVEKGEKYNYSEDRLERAVEIFASSFATTRYFTNKYIDTVKSKKGKEAEKMFDNFIKFFNWLYNTYGEEPGVSGMLVRSLHYLKNKLVNEGLQKKFIKRIWTDKKTETFSKDFILKRYKAVTGG